MKVLLIQVDVTELTEEEQESLMAQLEFTLPPDASLLASKIVTVDEEIDPEDQQDPIKH